MFPIVSDTPSLFATVSGDVPRIGSLLVKPASAACNLDCEYCFYLDRETDPYAGAADRIMSLDTLETLVDGFLFYSFPHSGFAFQGGEPTLAGLKFYETLVRLQQRHGRNGQTVGNSIQTNGILLNKDWCDLFRGYSFLIGLSLDGPEEIHDRYRVNKAGHPTAARVIEAVSLLRSAKVEFNVLCAVSQANVSKAGEVFRFFRKLGIEYVQFIPLAEFHPDGSPMPFTVSADEYGHFLCEMYNLWWPERRQMGVRFFENVAEALAGRVPGTCTLHESCDSYAVVEYNGDVYPCDFFVEKQWKLGNIEIDSWPEIARRQRRMAFAAKKATPHAACSVCEYQSLCRGGCPSSRRSRRGRFEDLDWFCNSYKQVFAKVVPPLREEVRRILAAQAAQQ